MEILARYIHGSEDSIDCDVIYIVDKVPSQREAPLFCTDNLDENRNIAVIEDGRIVWCHKGFPDEVNNALLATYPLHPQEDMLLIRERVIRDLPIKLLSVLRKIIMDFRHTSLKTEARRSLKGGFDERVRLLRSTDLRTLLWNISESKQMDRRKSMAFQLGQAIALSDGVELYTKMDIAEYIPGLRPYLYRYSCSVDALEKEKKVFLEILEQKHFEDMGNMVVCLKDPYKRYINLKGKEQDVSEVITWN